MIRQYSKTVFDAINKHIIGRPADEVLSFRQMIKVRDIVYRPGEERFSGDHINIWKPSPLSPVPGEAPAIYALLDHLFPVAEEQAHILDVLAFQVQHPAKKIRHALIIRGPQGSGKNTLFSTILSKLTGEKNIKVIGGEALLSRFNDEFVDTQVLVIDELMQESGFDVANKSKPLISEDLILAEAKYKSRRLCATPRLVCILSNHEVPWPIDVGDRRYFVPEFGRAKKEAEFYHALHAALAVEVPAFFSQLLSRDVSHFDPNRAPMDTAGKAAMQAAVKPPIERQIRQWLVDGEGLFGCDIVLPTMVLTELQNAGHRGATIETVKNALKAIGGQSLHQLPSGGGLQGRPRCWAIRNIEKWHEAGPAACAREIRNRFLT